MAFEPVNDLERSLIKAANDPAHRPQFYRDFLEARVFVIQHGQPVEHESIRELKKGEQVALVTMQRDGHSIIPIFSSLPRLNATIKEPASYLQMRSIDLLGMTRGTALILNPGSDYGKEFTAAEAASMLDGSIWQPHERFVAQKETQVMIGQPANYPNELVAALKRCFETMPQVKRAYLVHFLNPERDERAHTLIGLEVSGDWDQVVANAGIVAASVRIPDPPVDFLQITGKGGVEEHLRRNVKPFYQATALSAVPPRKGAEANRKSWWRFW